MCFLLGMLYVVDTNIAHYSWKTSAHIYLKTHFQIQHIKSFVSNKIQTSHEKISKSKRGTRKLMFLY